jgi:VIT1/CCC1 family predicted Fe2+/Mn2+ transporter
MEQDQSAPVSPAEESLRRDHEPEAISARISRSASHSYVGAAVFGAIDGAVTTFAVVSGVIGAELSSSIVLILGLANLLADGFSMAVGYFLGTKAQEESVQRRRRDEERQIDLIPAGEAAEVREIFRQKGFSGDVLEQIVATITADRDLWVNTMLTDELGLQLDGPSAVKTGLVTFLAFAAAGAMPLLTFAFNAVFDDAIPAPFLWSSVITAITFFGVGAAKSRVVERGWLRSGLETLIVGGAAAALAFGVGIGLRGLAD